MRTLRRHDDPAVVTDDRDYVVPSYGGWSVGSALAALLVPSRRRTLV